MMMMNDERVNLKKNFFFPSKKKKKNLNETLQLVLHLYSRN